MGDGRGNRVDAFAPLDQPFIRLVPAPGVFGRGYHVRYSPTSPGIPPGKFRISARTL